MKLKWTKNAVSALAIVALTIIPGLAIAYNTQFAYAIVITDIIAIAGLGGYSMKKGDIPLPADREAEQG